MSRVSAYHWRGTIITVVGYGVIQVLPDGEQTSIKVTGVRCFAQYASPAVGDRVSVLALGRQHYAQGKTS